MPPRKPPKDEDESPSGMHRRLEDGSMVEVTSPREPSVSSTGITLPWHWIGSGAMALFGIGVGGGNVLDRGHDELAKKAEVAKLQADVADLHKDIANVTKILDQIVTTKIILKESSP